MAFVSDIRGYETRITSRAADMFRSAAQAYDRRRLFNQTLRELQALGERELSDLGITRGDIDDIAYNAAYKD